MLALFVALGGTAYAVTAPKNSVVSSSIKKGQVKTSDLATSAVTGAKLGANAVDSSKVAEGSLTGADVADGSLTGADQKDDSLTGADIDESSLSLPTSLANDVAPPPVEGRVAIGAGEMAPLTAGSPEIALQRGFPAAFFFPTLDRRVAASTRIPLDRVPGTDVEVRILWEAEGTGTVSWRVVYGTFAPGEFIGAGLTGGSAAFLANSAASETMVETVALQIPGSSIANGEPLAVQVEREGTDPAETAGGVASLRMIDLRYTAEG
jgi:hypothetical protein